MRDGELVSTHRTEYDYMGKEGETYQEEIDFGPGGKSKRWLEDKAGKVIRNNL